jgi:parallel beta-helix repeat protein
VASSPEGEKRKGKMRTGHKALARIFAISISITPTAAQFADAQAQTISIVVLAQHGAPVISPVAADRFVMADIQQAFKKAREERTLFPNASITIELQAGDYRLAEPLVIDQSLAGSGTFTLQAQTNANTRIFGSMNLATSITKVSDDFRKRFQPGSREQLTFFDLMALGLKDYGTEVPRGFPYPRAHAEMEFFIEETALHEARWPAVGYAKISGATDPSVNKEAAATTMQLKGMPAVGSLGTDAVWAAGYFSEPWRFERVRVSSFDLWTSEIHVVRPIDGFSIKNDGLVWLEGAPALLTASNEFYLDRQLGILAVWLPKGVPASVVEASVLDNALTIRNSAHVNIRGIDFRNTRSDGIVVQGSHNVTFTNVSVENTGNRGIYVLGSSEVTLANLVIRGTGDEAVWLEGGLRKTLERGNNLVIDSNMSGFGRRLPVLTPGIWIWGVGNSVIGSSFSDSPSAAIQFSGNDHQIIRNEIFKVLSDCGDCGAIYTGRDWSSRGSVVADNFIHDLAIRPDREGKAIYLDDLASGVTVRRNLILGAMKGILVGGGRDNVVEHNLIIGSREYGISLDGRGTSWFADRVNDPNSDLRQRLAAVPYSAEPYKSRYPHLADILQDEPGQPKYDEFIGNIFLHGRGLQYEKDVRAEYVRTAGLSTLKIPTGDTFSQNLSLSFVLLGYEDVKKAIKSSGFPLDAFPVKQANQLGIGSSSARSKNN